jgi:hypothetical protein
MLYLRPVWEVNGDRERLLSIAVATTGGPILVDEQILDHYTPETPGREIKANYPDQQFADEWVNLNVKK